MSEKAGSRDSGTVHQPRAIVAGHGDFAAGLVSAVQQITGRGNVFYPVSARDLSANDLDVLLRRAVDETGVRVIFTDLQAGSCSMASRRVLRAHPEVLLVAGANLPMLLDFVFADKLSPTDAARHALERGREAITAIGGGESK
jgi:PTS system N-acetylgalactosamine-specific IIA component